MEVVIPFKTRNPKTRLSHIMDEKERVEFAKCMLFDVLDSIPEDVEVLILIPEAVNLNFERDVKIIKDSRSLNDAVNSLIGNEVAIIMSDLPLLNKKIVKNFLNQDIDVSIAPGRKGGTNMLLIRDSRFRVSYHYGSFFKHLEIAKKIGLRYKIFDSFYSSIDIDDESDLLELLMHGKGKRSWEFLVNLGFEVEYKKDPVLRIREKMRE